MTPLPYDRTVPVTVTTSAFGAPALDALAAAVRSAKCGDPLAPVAIIVPISWISGTGRHASDGSASRSGNQAPFGTSTRVNELCMIALWNNGRCPIRCAETAVAPKDTPNSVTLPGSPPKPEMLRCTHSSAACWSSNPNSPECSSPGNPNPPNTPIR